MSIKNYQPRKPSTVPTAQETFRLPLDLAHWLQRFALMKGIKRSEVIRQALQDLQRREKRKEG